MANEIISTNKSSARWVMNRDEALGLIQFAKEIENLREQEEALYIGDKYLSKPYLARSLRDKIDSAELLYVEALEGYGMSDTLLGPHKTDLSAWLSSRLAWYL